MTHKVVRYLNNPNLERPAQAITEFDTPELHQLIDDMFETMYAAHGLGLAAPQIDVHKRLTVIDTSGGEADVEPNKVILINPEIILKEGKQTGEEGCLSIPGFREDVRRHKRADRPRTQPKRRDLRSEWRRPDVGARHAARNRPPQRHPLPLAPEPVEARSHQAQNQKENFGGRVGMRLIFLGTPEFAVPTLEALVSAGHTILEVVTQPDRPKGRHQTLTPSPVKLAALRHDLKVWQPEKIRHADSVAHLQALAPDAMVIVGYGQIIPQSIIDIAPLGVINVHASLLPELRGAAPIQWSIARGYEKTGVTTMRIDAGLDTGDIAMKWETPVDPDETAPELSPRLASAGADLLLQTLNGLSNGTVKPVPQDNALATLAPILKKEDGRIDWTPPCQKPFLHLIRGCNRGPEPSQCSGDKSLRLWRSRLVATKWNLALQGSYPEDEVCLP